MLTAGELGVIQWDAVHIGAHVSCLFHECLCVCLTFSRLSVTSLREDPSLNPLCYS